MSAERFLSDNATPLMLHTLPEELLNEIYNHTDARTIVNISILNRHLHFSALQHLFDRNKVLDSSNTKVTLNTAENLHVVDGLCIALPAVIPPIRSILCVFNAPLETFFLECRSLRQLVMKIGTLEEAVLDFHQSLCTDDEWEVHPNRTNTAPLHDLLTTLSSGHCQSLTLSRGHLPWTPFIPTLVRRGGLLSGNFGALIGTILNLVREPPCAPSPRTSLHTLNIHSPLSFHPAFSTWRNSALTQPTIQTLSLKDTHQSSLRWSETLPLITLPNLTHLSLNDCIMSFKHRTAFLMRHRSITNLDLGFSNYPAATSRPPWFFLPNVTTISAPPRVIIYFLRNRCRPIGVLPNLRSITINRFFNPNHRFFFSGVNIDLGVVEKQLRGLELSFRAKVFCGAIAWLQPNPVEDPSDTKPLLRVKMVELCPDDREFLAIPKVQVLLPEWLRRFPQVKVLSIVGCVGVLEDGRDVRAELARGIVGWGTSVEVLRFDAEERRVEDWLLP